VLEEVEEAGGGCLGLVAYRLSFLSPLLLIFFADLLRLRLLLRFHLSLLFGFFHALWFYWLRQYLFLLLHGYFLYLLRQPIPLDLLKAKLMDFLEGSGYFACDLFELHQCVVTKRRWGGVVMMPLNNIMRQFCK
jgi:hypothetical protein